MIAVTALKIYTETGQDAGSWTRRSRWMSRVQLSEEGEGKGKFVAIARTDQKKGTKHLGRRCNMPECESSETGCWKARNMLRAK